jgi:putative addiction module component (TIGR02574 family)
MATTTTPEADEIVARALKLSEAEREDIAMRLLESVTSPNEVAATKAELQRRWDAIQRGETATCTAAEALAYAREQLRLRRPQ